VRTLKNAGAAEVHMRISSPPFKYTCHYGTDIDGEENLIANKMSLDEICHKIGEDSLGYISAEGLKEACVKCALPFCTACFTGYDRPMKTGKFMFEEGNSECCQSIIKDIDIPEQEEPEHKSRKKNIPKQKKSIYQSNLFDDKDTGHQPINISGSSLF
jgi:hypothetical protein